MEEESFATRGLKMQDCGWIIWFTLRHIRGGIGAFMFALSLPSRKVDPDGASSSMHWSAANRSEHT